MPALILPWIVEKLAVSNLRRFLEAEVPGKEVDQLMSKLNIPLRDNFFKREGYDLVTTKIKERDILKKTRRNNLIYIKLKK